MDNYFKIKKYTINFLDDSIKHPYHESIFLSKSESRILHQMMNNIGKIYKNNELEVIGWNGNPISSSGLSVTITSLRKKIEGTDIEIINTPRIGYKLICNSALRNGHYNLRNGCYNLFYILSTILVLYLLHIYTAKDNFSCTQLNKKTVCTTGKTDFSILNTLDNIGENNIILIDPFKIQIYDENFNLQVKFNYE